MFRIAGRYIQHEYESCLETDMLASNRRLLIRTYVTIPSYLLLRECNNYYSSAQCEAKIPNSPPPMAENFKQNLNYLCTFISIQDFTILLNYLTYWRKLRYIVNSYISLRTYQINYDGWLLNSTQH